MSMNVHLPKQTTVTQIPCAPTLKARMSAAVQEDTRAMV